MFELYALDTRLGLDGNASGGDVRDAIADHALAAGTLIGRFGR